MHPYLILALGFLLFVGLVCLLPINTESFIGKLTQCNGVWSISPVYNPFASPCHPWKYKTEFRAKPAQEPEYTANGYYAKFSGVLPDLGPYGFFDAKTLPLQDALTLGTMKNKYGIVAYQTSTGLARFYPYANFSNHMAVKFIPDPSWDTYMRT